ncbi:chitobiase [Bacteroides faecalis]|uniref:Chitobiase n=2 Tax=Bacteroides faecalis TaxID=2447885 RepID=A0A401LVD9_9BACE|nr:chitobiase [Bacteroides faecalis]
MISGLLLLAGCDISNRDNNLSEPLVYFINDGETTLDLYNTGENHTYTMPIFKSGLIEKEANIELEVDESLIELYNQENNTSAKLLPAEYYQIVNSKQTMGASQQKGNMQVVFKTSLLSENPNRDNYILPLSLSSKGEVQINSNKGSVIVSPVVKPATFGFTCANTLQEVIPTTASGKIEIALPIEAPFSNQWDIDFTASIDQTLLDEWNKKNELEYTQPISGSFELVGEQKLVAGKNTQTLKLILDKEKLGYGWFAIPIRLSNPSKFEIKEEQSTCVVTVLNRMEQIPYTQWSVESYTSYQGSEKPENMIDNNDNTRWHVKYNNSGVGTMGLPQTFVFKLNTNYAISEFEILRRGDTYNTDLKGGYFEISEDGTNWTKATTFDFGTEKRLGYVSFYCPIVVTGKYIKMVITESNRGANVSVQELRAYGQLSK